ncbi:MAG: hypothetical protein MAG715_01254 [Methanonatronarchaeales archaeon]|nr:hypothetical protein [Methanonatronarchaeales archaeon]
MNRDTLNSIFFFVFVAAIGIVSLIVLRPLLTYLIAAAMLVFVTYPLYEAVERRTGRPRLSSALVVFALIVAVITPSAIVTSTAINESGQVVSAVMSTGIDGFFDIGRAEAFLEEATGRPLSLEERVDGWLREIGQGFTERLTELVEAVTSFIVGVFVMVFAMFYLYRDGPAAVSMTRDILPMDEGRKDAMFQEVRTVTWAMVAGHLFTSIVQGAVGAVGFFLFGVGNAAFWGFVMIILALIPVIGPLLLYIPAAAVMLLNGETVQGTGLLVYGVVVVSMVDNLVRPLLVEKRAHVHPVITLVGVLGGLSVFGIMGLFIGPVILAVFMGTLRTYLREREGAPVREA